MPYYIDKLADIKDFEEIQEDLFELCRWTIKWQLFFNLNKCKVLHLGLNNPQYEYKMTDMNGNLVDVQKVENEKDLGIIFQSNMKFDQHTPQPLYNTVRYNTVLDITRISVGPQMIIKDCFCYITIHFTLIITLIG